MASSSDPSRSPGDNDFSASRFRKTVCLYDWWLTQAADDSQEKTLAVSGLASPRQQSVQQVVRVFKSAPITKRYDFSTLETADGVCVVVSGLINKSRTTESGFSPEIFKHFVFGFPPNWEDCASKCLEKEAKIVLRLGNESSDLSTSRGGKRKHEIHEIHSIRNAAFVTIKKVTRSGSKSPALSGSRDYCGRDERSLDKCKRDTNANKHDAQLQNDFSPEKAKSQLTGMDPDLPNGEIEETQENHLFAALGGERINKVDEDNSLMNATIVTNRRVTRLGSKSVALSISRDSSGLDRRSSDKYKRDATENKHAAQLPNDFSPQNTESCLAMLESNVLNAEIEGTQDSRRSAAVDESKVYSPQKTGGKGKGIVNKNTFCGEPTVFKTPTGSQGSSFTSPDSFKRSRFDYCGADERSSDKCKRVTNVNKHDAQLQNDFSPEKAKSHLTSMDPDLPNVEVEGTQENHLSATLDESILCSPQKTGGKRIGKVDEDYSLKNATIVTSRRVTRLGSKSVALSSSRDNSGLDRRSSGKYKRDATEYKHDAQLPNDFSPENTRSCLDVMEPNLLNAEAEGTQGGKGKGDVNRNIYCGESIVFKTPTDPQGSSLTSPDSFKRSRSGRILLPRLEFWRNQVAVYALDRGVAGVQEGPSLSFDEGSKSS